MCLIAAALLLAAVGAETSWAHQAPGSYTMGVVGGGYFFEGEQNVDNAPFFGMSASHQFTEHWAVEGLLTYATVQTNYFDTTEGVCKTNTDIDAYYFKADGLYFFSTYGKVVPYFSAGVGGLWLRDDKGVQDEAQSLMNWGAGLKYLLGPQLAFRAELRHVHTFQDSNDNATLTGFLTWEFMP